MCEHVARMKLVNADPTQWRQIKYFPRRLDLSVVYTV